MRLGRPAVSSLPKWIPVVTSPAAKEKQEFYACFHATIGRGLKDLNAAPAGGRALREGGGPRSLIERDANLVIDLERLVAPSTRGAQMI